MAAPQGRGDLSRRDDLEAKKAKKLKPSWRRSAAPAREKFLGSYSLQE
jgi:hypothetical protein